MALTVTYSRASAGSQRLHYGTIAFDSSYLNGGESLTAAMLGFHSLSHINVHPTLGYVFYYDPDSALLLAYRSAGFTPAGTNSAPTFTGSALAAHRHTLHFQTSAAANAVTAATNQLRTAAAAFDVAGVADSTGEGGVVDATGGTPAGTVSAPTFTGTAVAAGVLVEVANGVDLSSIIPRFEAFGR